MSERGARLVVILYGLVPAPIFFIARLEAPLLALAVWSLAFHSLSSRRKAWLLAAGIAAGLGTLVSFSMLAWVAALFLYWLLERATRGQLRPLSSHWPAMGRELAWLIAGMVLPWLPFLLNPSFHLLAVYEEAMRFHRHILRLRSPNQWILFNLWEFFLFQNVAVMYFFLLKIASEGNRVRRRDFRLEPLALTAIIALLSLDLARVTSGEVARIWMFLTPLYILPAGARIAELSGRRPWLVLLCSFFIQAVILIGLYSR
jgi:hypothetical protein